MNTGPYHVVYTGLFTRVSVYTGRYHFVVTTIIGKDLYKYRNLSLSL